VKDCVMGGVIILKRTLFVMCKVIGSGSSGRGASPPLSVAFHISGSYAGRPTVSVSVVE